MIIKKNSKFALVGHGLILYKLANLFKKNGLNKPIVITHHKKFHKRDFLELSRFDNLHIPIEKIEREFLTYYVKNFDLKIVKKILEKNKITHIFSCSSRFIFKEKILKKFKRKIFNLHPSILPKERGSGVITYRILNSNFFCAGTLHLINDKIDEGDIVLQSKKLPVSSKSLPLNMIKKTNEIYFKILKKFIKNITNEKKFSLKKQNNKDSTYTSRFYTDIMGAIDWNLKGEDIKKFIQGCSIPYSGAFCFIKYKNKLIKLRIFKINFSKTKTKNHPNLVGKIFYQNKKIIKIFATDGFFTINLDYIKFNNKSGILKKNVKFLGKTLFNEPKNLIKAKTFIPKIFKYKLDHYKKKKRV